jgi:hypothetical protein
VLKPNPIFALGTTVLKSNSNLEAEMLQIVEQSGSQLSATLYYKYGLMEVDLTIEQCSQMLQEIS